MDTQKYFTPKTHSIFSSDKIKFIHLFALLFSSYLFVRVSLRAAIIEPLKILVLENHLLKKLLLFFFMISTELKIYYN